MSALNHLSEETLELYVLDRLPAVQTAKIEEHLLLCPGCVDACLAIEEWVLCIRGSLERLHECDVVASKSTPPVETARAVFSGRSSKLQRWSFATAASLFVVAMLTANMVLREEPTSTLSALPTTLTNRPLALDHAYSRDFASSSSGPRSTRHVRPRRVRDSRNVRVARVKALVLPPVLVVHHKPELMDTPPELALPVENGDDFPLSALVTDLPDDYLERKRPSAIRRFFGTIVKALRHSIS